MLPRSRPYGGNSREQYVLFKEWSTGIERFPTARKGATFRRHPHDPKAAEDSIHGSVSEGRRPQRYQFVFRGTIWKTSNGVQRSDLRRWVIGKVPDGS
jgi:hypothetical protein